MEGGGAGRSQEIEGGTGWREMRAEKEEEKGEGKIGGGRWHRGVRGRKQGGGGGETN